MLTRRELAQRWKLSLRTIDRMRLYGQLPYVDLSKGVGRRPIVRFVEEDIIQLEESMKIRGGAGEPEP